MNREVEFGEDSANREGEFRWGRVREGNPRRKDEFDRGVGGLDGG